MPHPEEARAIAVDAQAMALLSALSAGVAGNLGDVLAWGSYTPDITNQTNISASSIPSPWSWIRIGNIVLVSGRVDITQTAGAGTFTEARVTVPVASTFENTGDAGGTFAPFSGVTQVFAAAALNGAPYTMRLTGLAQAVGAVAMLGSFMYKVS
jgi:hypothetical protein